MRILSVILITTAVLGCSSSTKLPPVSPDDVHVYMPGQEPHEAYVVVWETNDYMVSMQRPYRAYNTYPSSWTADQLVEHLKKEAAKHGADALLIEYITEPTEPSAAYSRTPRWKARALAICILRLHPELAEKK